MEQILATGRINANGKLELTNEHAFKKAIQFYPNTEVTVIVERIRTGISHRQRKYFFGVIVDLLHAFFTTTGTECSKHDVVDMLKDRFLFREKLNPVSSRYIKVPISLSDSEGAMTREEFTNAKEAIQKWASETLDLDVPDPDPHWRMYKQEK